MGLPQCGKLTDRCDFATRVWRWRYWRRWAFVLTQRHTLDSATTVQFICYCLGPTTLRLSRCWRITTRSVFDVNAWTTMIADANNEWYMLFSPRLLMKTLTHARRLGLLKSCMFNVYDVTPWTRLLFPYRLGILITNQTIVKEECLSIIL